MGLSDYKSRDTCSTMKSEFLYMKGTFKRLNLVKWQDIPWKKYYRQVSEIQENIVVANKEKNLILSSQRICF